MRASGEQSSLPGGDPARVAGGTLLILPLVLAAGAILRFAALEVLPPAHYRDVALTAMDALRAASGDPRVHYTYDEGLYANLLGLVFAIFGPSDWTVRALGALFGLLTCWGVLRLGRALGEERAGLWGAGLLAVSSWHVVLSRSGFRAILLPCLLVFSVACLVEGLRRGGSGRLLLSGALFGLGVHVYPAVRFAPLILPAYLVMLWRDDPGGRRRLLRGVTLFVLAAFLVAAPMLVDYLRHPEHFTYPHRVVSVFSPKLGAGEGPGLLADNLVKTLLMFHLRGDPNARHHFPGAPLLDPPSGILWIAGILLVARGGWRGEGPHGPGSGRAGAALLLSWTAVMLLPNLLSAEGVPHALRSCGVLPALLLVAGIGLARIEERIGRRFGRRAAAGLAAVLVLAVGMRTADRYFRDWGRDPAVARAHDADLRAAARVLRDAPAGVARLLLANGEGFPAYGHPVETQVYLFELREAPPVLLGPKDAARLVLNGRPALVAFERKDDRALAILRDLNPGAPVEEVRSPGLAAEHPVYRVN